MVGTNHLNTSFEMSQFKDICNFIYLFSLFLLKYQHTCSTFTYGCVSAFVTKH